MEAISQCIAHEAIRQLVARYCHYVRTRNIAGIIGLYAPDGVFDMPANMAEGGVRDGPDAIEETFRRHLERLDPWPFTHNHLIEVLNDNEARGWVYTDFRLGSQNMRVAHIGVYADEYVKIGGDWKFQARRLSAIDVDG